MLFHPMHAQHILEELLLCLLCTKDIVWSKGKGSKLVVRALLYQ